jgi:hypothetical protein
LYTAYGLIRICGMFERAKTGLPGASRDNHGRSAVVQ